MQSELKKAADLEREVGGLREMIGLISQLIHQSIWVDLEIASQPMSKLSKILVTRGLQGRSVLCQCVSNQ